VISPELKAIDHSASAARELVLSVFILPALPQRALPGALPAAPVLEIAGIFSGPV